MTGCCAGACVKCAPWMFPNPPKPKPIYVPPYLDLETEVQRWAEIHPWHDRACIRENIAIGMACGSYTYRPFFSRRH